MNIFELQAGLQQIIDQIEANEGELTPELEEQLDITADAFVEKVKSYTAVIKQTKSDILLIKEEKERLDNIKKSKEKLIQRLEDILIPAIEKFGDKSKSGASYIDYTTGKVSVRKSEAVDENEDRIKTLGVAIELEVECEKVNNQLSVIDNLELENINLFKVSNVEDNDQYDYTLDELKHTTATVSVEMPTIDVINGKGFNVLREMANYSDKYKISTKLNKSEIKEELKQNGALLPNLAKLKINKSLIIK